MVLILSSVGTQRARKPRRSSLRQLQFFSNSEMAFWVLRQFCIFLTRGCRPNASLVAGHQGSPAIQALVEQRINEVAGEHRRHNLADGDIAVLGVAISLKGAALGHRCHPRTAAMGRKQPVATDRNRPISARPGSGCIKWEMAGAGIETFVPY